MAFKLRSGNKVNFKEIGSSPLPKTFATIDESKNTLKTTTPSLTEKGGSFGGSATNLGGDTKLGDGVDEKRDKEKKTEEVKKIENKKKANPRKVINPKNWWEPGYGEDTDTETKTEDKYDAEGNLLKPEKKDFFSDIRPLLDLVSGKKRKAKKADRLKEAKEAEASGTETYKQAKFVDKAERKQVKSEKRIAKKKAKSDKKLAEYRKKNPVIGKEGIALATKS